VRESAEGPHAIGSARVAAGARGEHRLNEVGPAFSLVVLSVSKAVRFDTFSTFEMVAKQLDIRTRHSRAVRDVPRRTVSFCEQVTRLAIGSSSFSDLEALRVAVVAH
jgi:hypothetical protein